MESRGGKARKARGRAGCSSTIENIAVFTLIYTLLQVLRYGPTNKYGPHMDGLNRVMSVLIYLVGKSMPPPHFFTLKCSKFPTQGPLNAPTFLTCRNPPGVTFINTLIGQGLWEGTISTHV